jgi:hypothetical protein
MQHLTRKCLRQPVFIEVDWRRYDHAFPSRDAGECSVPRRSRSTSALATTSFLPIRIVLKSPRLAPEYAEFLPMPMIAANSGHNENGLPRSIALAFWSRPVTHFAFLYHLELYGSRHYKHHTKGAIRGPVVPLRSI